MNKLLTTLLFCTVVMMSAKAEAQNQNEIIKSVDPKKNTEVSDSLAKENQEKINLLQNDFGKWGTLTIGGYFQVQWQMAESEGAGGYTAGGDFPEHSNNRFMIRRGRIKFAYDLDFASVVIVPSLTEKGVTLREAYAKFASNNNKWVGSIGLTDVPFGYELLYSSSLRESVERSRVVLSLFPGYHMGILGTYNVGDFSFDAGVFNGNNLAIENDSFKDLAVRASWLKNFDNKLELGASASYYNGCVISGQDYYYDYDNEDGFKANQSELYDEYLRQYFTVGVKVLTDFGIGKSNIRAEYLFGRQPGTLNVNNSLIGGALEQEGALYLRDFCGWYVIYAQDIANSRHQVVLKYDYYDPNIRVEGKRVGYASNTGVGDIAYSTFGVGYNFAVNDNIRIMAYYDMVGNETTDAKISELKDYSQRLKENIFTLRLQLKF